MNQLIITWLGSQSLPDTDTCTKTFEKLFKHFGSVTNVEFTEKRAFVTLDSENAAACAAMCYRNSWLDGHCVLIVQGKDDTPPEEQRSSSALRSSQHINLRATTDHQSSRKRKQKRAREQSEVRQIKKRNRKDKLPKSLAGSGALQDIPRDEILSRAQPKSDHESLEAKLAAIRKREAELAERERKIEENDRKLEEEWTCCICQDLLLKTMSLKCGHVACEMCLDSWLKTNPICPTCRTSHEGPPIPIKTLDNTISHNIGSLLSSDDLEARKQREIEWQTWKDTSRAAINLPQ
eukprot:936398_1